MKLTTILYMLIGFAALIYGTHLLAPDGLRHYADAHDHTAYHNADNGNNTNTPHNTNAPHNDNTSDTPKNRSEHLPANCGDLLTLIHKNINQQKAECFVNEDCKVVRFACPYQIDPCRFFMLGKDDTHRNKMLKKAMQKHQEECLKKGDAASLAACNTFQRIATVAQCRDPRTIEALCINGTCQTKTQAMMQYNQDGVDEHHSLQVISPE